MATGYWESIFNVPDDDAVKRAVAINKLRREHGEGAVDAYYRYSVGGMSASEARTAAAQRAAAAQAAGMEKERRIQNQNAIANHLREQEVELSRKRLLLEMDARNQKLAQENDSLEALGMLNDVTPGTLNFDKKISAIERNPVFRRALRGENGRILFDKVKEIKSSDNALMKEADTKIKYLGYPSVREYQRRHPQDRIFSQEGFEPGIFESTLGGQIQNAKAYIDKQELETTLRATSGFPAPVQTKVKGATGTEFTVGTTEQENKARRDALRTSLESQRGQLETLSKEAKGIPLVDLRSPNKMLDEKGNPTDSPESAEFYMFKDKDMNSVKISAKAAQSMADQYEVISKSLQSDAQELRDMMQPSQSSAPMPTNPYTSYLSAPAARTETPAETPVEPAQSPSAKKYRWDDKQNQLIPVADESESGDNLSQSSE